MNLPVVLLASMIPFLIIKIKYFKADMGLYTNYPIKYCESDKLCKNVVTLGICKAISELSQF
jgi:hypothetical protein